ncbi:MAG: thermonuclease family protein [Planctomycetaceae bacterium]
MRPTPRWRPRRRRFSVRFVVLLLLAALAVWRLAQLDPDRAPPPPRQESVVFVRRAVDGDTLLLSDGQRVRLLGVDTPETKREETPIEPWGPEAHEFTRRHVEGRSVLLRYDRERRDKYNRLLAYVYVGDFFLNEELIRAGFGRAITNHPYQESMKRRFRQAEREAREAQRGIWSRHVESRSAAP